MMFSGFLRSGEAVGSLLGPQKISEGPKNHFWFSQKTGRNISKSSRASEGLLSPWKVSDHGGRVDEGEKVKQTGKGSGSWCHTYRQVALGTFVSTASPGMPLIYWASGTEDTHTRDSTRGK